VIPFREAWGWAIVLPVTLGGAGVHELLLDTGSASTIVEPSLAAELGVVAVARANLVTPHGSRAATVGGVELWLGGVTLPAVEVLVAELPALHGGRPRVRGILGQSALGRLEYTIDHARRRVVVHRARPPRGDEEPTGWRPSRVAPARPVVEARPGCGAGSLRMVLDSGVPVPVLFAQGDRRLQLELGGRVRAATNAGDALWREGRLASLCVAGRRSGPLRVVVRPETAPARDEDGLLPSRHFARVRFGLDGVVAALQHW